MKSTRMLVGKKPLKVKIKYRICAVYLRHLKSKRTRAAVKKDKANKEFIAATEDTLKLMVAIDKLIKEG